MASNRINCQSNGTQRKSCQYKLVLLGESAVGKSGLALRLANEQFHEHQQSTTDATLLTQSVCLDDTTVKFEIWDTPGRERYRPSTATCYRDAQAAIIVYDLTNKDSYDKAKGWVKELQRQVSPNIVIAMVGNKTDLSGKRAVKMADVAQYAAENGFLFMETSAKTGANASKILTAIADNLLFRGKISVSDQTSEELNLSTCFVYADGQKPVIKDLLKAKTLLEEFEPLEDDEIEWSDCEDLRPTE